MLKETISSVVTANSSNRIVQDLYVEGLFSSSTGSVNVTLVPNGVDNTGVGVSFEVSPNDTGDVRYIDIYARNHTGSSITLAHDITITVIKSTPL